MSIPTCLQSVLSEYAALLKQSFDKNLVGSYLVGSLSLNAYEEKLSDIDFIAIFQNPLAQEDICKIRSIHSELDAKYDDSKKMDGMYLSIDCLGKQNNSIPPYPYRHEGRIDVGHWDINNVTWWLLKNKGITLTGQEANRLPFNIEWDDVLYTMRYNINSYWQKQLKRYSAASIITDPELEWAVLTLCRIYYTIHNHDIVSKTYAGRDALAALKNWERVISEALRIRHLESPVSLYESASNRTTETIEFANYIISLCQEKLKKAGII